MALKASTQEKCSCVSPDSSRLLSSKKRQGLEILHQKEGLITEAECVKCSDYYGRCKVMAQIIPAKSISESLKIREICEQYQLLYDDDMKLFEVLVDVYHKEQLVTKEEAEDTAFDVQKWTEVAVTKDVDNAARIADILVKHGFHNVARHLRVLVDVYHKEQLVTKEEAERVASDKLKWTEIAVTKGSVTATRIADILDKYGFNDVAQRIRESPSTLNPLTSTPSPRRSKPSRSVELMSTTGQSLSKETWMSLLKYSGLRFDRVTKSSTGMLSRKPRFSQYATSDTSVLDTSISKTGPDIDSSEPKSQEKATIMRELETSEKVSIVGKMNTNEELQRAFQKKDRSHTYEVPISYMSPEAVLSRKCWLPFGYDSITVDRRGDTYDLCSDGLTKLTVARNAVRGETAEIQYAIIGKGPFQLPPNYQLGSFVVYVHYNFEEITTPVTLSLPTWYGGDVVPGEPPPDGLSFAVAPHTLGLRDTQYTFQLIDRGEFRDSRVHDVSIDGHSSLFTVVFKEGVKSLYLATHLMVKKNAKETTHNIFVTYASPTWIEIYKKIHGEDAIKFKEQFKFKNPPSGKLVGEVEKTSGNGWAVAIAGCPELRQKEISYGERGLKTAKQLRIAVKNELYPPKLTFSVASTISRGEQTTPKWVNCTIQGTDRPLQFPLHVVERISSRRRKRPPLSAQRNRKQPRVVHGKGFRRPSSTGPRSSKQSRVVNGRGHRRPLPCISSKK